MQQRLVKLAEKGLANHEKGNWSVVSQSKEFKTSTMFSLTSLILALLELHQPSSSQHFRKSFFYPFVLPSYSKCLYKTETNGLRERI